MYGAAPSLASAMDDDKPVYFKKVNAPLERTGGGKKTGGERRGMSSPHNNDRKHRTKNAAV